MGRTFGRHALGLTVATAAVFVTMLSGPVPAGAQRFELELQPGAVEIGVAGSFRRVEGIHSGTFWARGGMFAEVSGGLGGMEVGFGYTHEKSLDVFDFEGVVSWSRRLGARAHYPFVSFGGGARHDAIGSFSQTRYPLGFGLGIRSLVGRKAGFRLEYRFRRVLGDPVADFSEHEIVVGISVFLRNSKRVEPGGL